MSQKNKNSAESDSRLQRIKETIKSYPDFPKKGILFRYISSDNRFEAFL